MAKSAKPSGLSISRSGGTFTCSWKLPSHGYSQGQNFQYSIGYGWNNVSIGKATTSKALGFSVSSSFSALTFRVQGNQRWSTGSGKKKKDHNPGMSDWVSATFYLSAPAYPSVSTEQPSWPTTRFKWEVATADDDGAWFYRVEYQTVRLQDSNVEDGNAVTGWGASMYSGSNNSYYDVTEDSGKLNDGHSYTRWFRVRSWGPAGCSSWAYAKHVYAMPNLCSVTNKEITPSKSVSGYTAKVWFDSPFSASRPIDVCKVQYALATPDADMECPDGASWTDGAEIKPADSTSGALFSIDSIIGLDQCLFVRVNAEYDGRTTYGVPVVADVGKLTMPTITEVSAEPSTHKVTVKATNNSSVPDSFLVVRYMSKEDPNGFDIAIIPHGQTQVVGVQCPAWTSSPTLGVYAVAPGGCYEVTTRDDGIGSYAVTPGMASDLQVDGGKIPEYPGVTTATPFMASGTIRVTWEWAWDEADSAELSWSDHEDAWESTSQPQTYEVSKMYASAWNISGLETGKRWYVRVRLIKTTVDGKTYGSYSDTMAVDLSSAPLIPVIILSAGIIPPDGQVTASWVYSTTDGTSQAFAEVASVVEDEDNPGEYIYTPLQQAETQQHITLDAAELGWTAGDTIALAVRVASKSGHTSDGWSIPATVTIAEPPTCTISSTSLENVTVTTTDEEGDPVTETVLALTELPLTATITGAGRAGTTAIAIQRTAAFHVDRPNEQDYNGFEGETVAVASHVGEDAFTINYDDLIGYLDDGAPYTLVATVTDGLGQSATQELNFQVIWDHQASAPTADIEIDSEHRIAIITPIAPADADPTDVCDIYRLSIDKPELIYSGAEFGEDYVDPYPAIGRFGGHRLVTRTANGDVTTPDGSFAWIDYGEVDDDTLNTRYNIIDFGDGQVAIDLDVDISNQWRKDFKETQYLGGSVQGDWNMAISRTATVSGTAIPGRDDDVIQSMRRLADNAGICHVRTKDGSSYNADVQVGEKYNYANGVKTYEYSMTITRVEPEELDGMTLAEWQNINGDESE